MAWVESHQSLRDHRKTLHLAALLKCDRFKVIGHLHCLWWWALDNADASGNIGRISDEDLSKASCWPLKTSSKWSRSLLESGFIECKEGLYTIHDWYDFAGKLNDQRELRRISNRKAQQGRRERLRQQDVSADGQHASAVYRPNQPNQPAAAPPTPARAHARERPYEGQLLPDIAPMPESLLAEHERLLARERATRSPNGK